MANYRIVRLLGKGGFGSVYEAIHELTSQRVALKMLRSNAGPRILERFRDEARILSLIRDRAVVRADPPVRFEEGWAVIMDLAPGVSAARLLHERGPFPSSAALETVAEVARALDHVFRQEGPQGPLRVLHRDLKPSNLQLSESGEVRILDFGNARAVFPTREAHTTHHIGGTPGYIAPERMAGQEGPEGDIYSLGVVLHELATGVRPGQDPSSPQVTAPTVSVDTEPVVSAPRPRPPEPIADPVGELVRLMIAPSHTERPTAREVVSLCRQALRSVGEPDLLDFAEIAVPASRPRIEDDERVGTVVHTTD
ncbi:MAG TPA: serine/threonine protein kinase [Deltaproteobacteria bacterium]|nr:serine/threonine protein kinase [Deltaproteobacteria bacterium]